MNIPFFYCRQEVARLSENVTFMDTPHIEKHRYTLVEKTYLGLIRRRQCRYRTSLKYLSRSFTNRGVYDNVIKPWLDFDDVPLMQYLESSRRLVVTARPELFQETGAMGCGELR